MLSPVFYIWSRQVSKGEKSSVWYGLGNVLGMKGWNVIWWKLKLTHRALRSETLWDQSEKTKQHTRTFLPTFTVYYCELELRYLCARHWGSPFSQTVTRAQLLVLLGAILLISLQGLRKIQRSNIHTCEQVSQPSRRCVKITITTLEMHYVTGNRYITVTWLPAVPLPKKTI